MRFRQVRVIGGQSSGPEKFFFTLRGIWIDRQDRLHAAGDSQVKAFDTTGRLLRRWGTAKPAASVAVSGDGSLYVGQAAQVEIFDKAGSASRVWLPEAQTGQVTAIGFFGDEILLADGMFFVLEGKTGMLRLIEANTTGYKELGKAQVLSGQDVWGPMALSDGKLVLRDLAKLVCIDVRGR